jgi:hypothetical protein
MNRRGLLSTHDKSDYRKLRSNGDPKLCLGRLRTSEYGE